MTVSAEASGDGDGVVTGATIEGEPSSVEEAAEVQTQADALLEDVEAIVETKKLRCEGVEFSVFDRMFCKKYFGRAEALHIS
jgi:hypothetical protein